MIKFSLPALSLSLSDYMVLVELWENCTSCVGFCVSLGDLFFTNGIKEIDEIILPHLTTQAGVDVIPRVLPSYAILHWFTVQVRNEFF